MCWKRSECYQSPLFWPLTICVFFFIDWQNVIRIRSKKKNWRISSGSLQIKKLSISFAKTNIVAIRVCQMLMIWSLDYLNVATGQIQCVRVKKIIFAHKQTREPNEMNDWFSRSLSWMYKYADKNFRFWLTIMSKSKCISSLAETIYLQISWVWVLFRSFFFLLCPHSLWTFNYLVYDFIW